MTRKEILQLLSELMGAYPNGPKDPEATVRVWELMFGEYDASDVYKAARVHMSKSSYFPTPHDIIKSLTRGQMLYNESSNAPLLSSSSKKEIVPKLCKGSWACPYFQGELCYGSVEEQRICYL